jgi:hypothetical protein
MKPSITSASFRPSLIPTGQVPGDTAISGPKPPTLHTARVMFSTVAMLPVRSTLIVRRCSTPGKIEGDVVGTGTAHPVAEMLSVSSRTTY